MTALTEVEIECIVSLSSSVLSMIGAFIVLVLEWHTVWTERVLSSLEAKQRRITMSFVLNLGFANFIYGLMQWIHFAQMLSWPSSTHVWDEHGVQMVQLCGVIWTFGTICFFFVMRILKCRLMVTDGESSAFVQTIRRADTILYVTAVLAYGLPLVLAISFKVFERYAQ